jgi:hypothetical protein
VLPERAEFLPYASVDLARYRPAPPTSHDVPLVVHAPSDRRVKGTRHLIAAVDRLREDGVPLELRLVEGLTRDEAVSLFSEADVFVDQLLAGWYGGAALEAMALARPVVAYIRQQDLALVPRSMREELPVASASPETIESVLRGLLESPREALHALGRRSRAFAERWHDPLVVGARMRDVYTELVEGRE